MRTITALLCLFFFAHNAEAKPRQRVTNAPISKPAHQVAIAPDSIAPAFGLVSVARFFLGRNPTDMHQQWCGRFMRLVLQHTGHGDPGPSYDVAYSFRRIGKPGKASAGAIVYWSHHVGVIVQITRPGHAIVISGNDGPKGGRIVMERERSISGAGFRYL